MSKIEVNEIDKQNGSTLTLGGSGTAVTLASGATQSGFGRTGTVDWQTGSIKTAGFTAVSGEGYFCNTTSSAFTVTLPASPSGGDIVAIKDYAQTFSTNNITVGRNSSNIEGTAVDVTLDGNAEAVTFVYVDGTKGWVLVNEATTLYGPAYITATGGCISTSGDFKYHKFTGPGTFTVCSVGNSIGSNTVTTLVVAGGGGGHSNGGGGGGAGGLRNLACISVTAQAYPITVGAGGTGGPPTADSTAGANSVAITTTSAGGGRGGSESGGTGGNGGSGGGAGGNGGNAGTGGTGNTPPVTPPQGNPGGSHGPVPNYNSGAGGGGSGSAGAGGPSPGSPGNPGGTGGNGTDVSPSFPAPLGGSPAGFYAGGGGGAANCDGPGSASNTPSAPGGGGFGAAGPGASAGAGTANTGGGGGGSPTANGVSGGGGSGIVIIKYKFQN